MTTTTEPSTLGGRVREALAALEPLARRGLEAMLPAGSDRFCFRALPDERREDGLVLEGASDRYGAMVLIGLGACDGRLPEPFEPVRERLVAWALEEAQPGDASLVLWALVALGDPRAEEVARSLVARRAEVLAEDRGFTTMEGGWLLAGLAEALAAGVEADGLEEFARGVARRLRACQREPGGLFSFGVDLARRNQHAARLDRRLGSFATQVYPTLALARLARATGDAEAAAAARRCAERTLALQGDDGQWWWIYDAWRARPVVRYPVYSVHQDGMAPMALLSVAEPADRELWLAAILRGLEWIEQPAERSDAGLVDAARGVVWRAVQRDPMTATGKLGLGRRERLRMHLAAWTGREDRGPCAPAHVCRECRPYHLGWILLARRMLDDVLGREPKSSNA